MAMDNVKEFQLLLIQFLLVCFLEGCLLPDCQQVREKKSWEGNDTSVD